MALALSLLLAVVAGDPVPTLEFIFSKQYQVDPDSHFLWDTKRQTQALMGLPALHWGQGTLLPGDSGVVLKTGNEDGREYRDVVAFAPHSELASWPAVSLDPAKGASAVVLSFWYKLTFTQTTTILVKHVSSRQGNYQTVNGDVLRNEILHIYYVPGLLGFGGNGMNVKLSLIDGSTGQFTCDRTGEIQGEWNRAIIQIDTSGTGTSVSCMNNDQTAGNRAILTVKWKDVAAEPLYLRDSGLDGDTNALYIYNLAIYNTGVANVNDFSDDLKNCGATARVGFACTYCPVGFPSCLFSGTYNQYLSNNVLTNCPTSCATCSDAFTCVQCKVGFYPSRSTNTCSACDSRCAHCWGPHHTQCYACKTQTMTAGSTDRPVTTWMVANFTCEGQASFMLSGSDSGSMWVEPLKLPVNDRITKYQEFSVDFWVKLNQDASQDGSSVLTFIDFGRHFFYIHTGDSHMYFEDFKTKKSVTLNGPFTNKNWVLAAYAMDKYDNRRGYAAARSGPGASFLYSSPPTTPFDYQAPSMIVLNGHHSYQFRRTSCGFNNIRMWGKFRSMVEVMGDMNIYYTPQSAPPHLFVNYPVLNADRSFVVNSALVDPQADEIAWNKDPFSFQDSLNATATIPGSPYVYFSSPSENLNGDYGSGNSYSGINVCPFSLKSPQPALFDSSNLCRDQLRFRFDSKALSQVVYDTLNYKSLWLGTTRGPDTYDPGFVVGSDGKVSEAGLAFSKSLLTLPPAPPEVPVPAMQIRTSMTFEAWIKPTALTKTVVGLSETAVPLDSSTIFSMKTTRPHPTRVLYLQLSAGKHYLSYFTKANYGVMNSQEGRFDISTDFATGKWTHVALVLHLHNQAASVVSGYVDGRLTATQLTNDPNDPRYTRDLVMEPFSAPVIGATYQFGKWQSFFQGSIYEFTLNNYARSDSEIGQSVLRGCSGTTCSACPASLAACPSLSLMTGIVPSCSASCKTCTDGQPSNCLSCPSGTFLQSSTCVKYCSGVGLGTLSTGVCDTVSTLSISTTTVVFDGHAVAITFTNAFNLAVDCMRAFVTESMNALGEMFTCNWDALHKIFTVKVGTRANLAAGLVLTFADGALTEYPDAVHTISAQPLPALTLTETLPTVRASIAITQNVLSKCEDILFTALGSEGVGLQYAWNFFVFPIDNTNNQFTEQYGGFASQHFEALLPKKFFQDGTSLQAVLYVKDMFGTIDTATYTYALSYSEVPTAYFPYGDANTTIFRSQSYNFPLDLRPTHCQGHSEKARKLTVTWTLDRTNAAGTPASAILSGGGNDHNLRLANFSMEAGFWYTYKAVVQDEAYGASAVLNTTFSLPIRAPVPVISGGNRVFPADQPLELDAKLSYDPDYPTVTVLDEYCWAIACDYDGKTSGSRCLKKTDYTCAVGNTVPKLLLSSEDLVANAVYTFTLTVKRGKRAASLATTIKTVPVRVPMVEIAPITTSPVKFPTTRTQTFLASVRTVSRVEAVTNQTAFINNGEQTLSYWRLSPAVANALSPVEFSYTTTLSGLSSMFTGTYTVNFYVEDFLLYKGYRGQAWMTAATNSPPVGAVVYLNPSWAVPAFSEVQISVEGAWDKEIPLSYEFYRVQGSTSQPIASKYSYGLLGRLMVPLSPNPVYHEVRIYDSLGDFVVLPITFLSPGRPETPNVYGWFSEVNQKVASYLEYDVDIAFANALTYAESLNAAMASGIVNTQDSAFSSLVTSFLTLLNSDNLKVTTRTSDFKLQILAALSLNAQDFTSSLHANLQSMAKELVEATGNGISPAQYPNIFSLYTNLRMDARAVPALLSAGVQFNGKLQFTAGDSSLLITRDQFQQFYPNPISKVQITVGTATVTVSPGAFALNNTECIDTRAVLYSYNPVDSTQSISAVLDLSFFKTCTYDPSLGSQVMAAPTALSLASGTTVTITLPATLDSRYNSRSYQCLMYDDTLGWMSGICAFKGVNEAAGTVTCSCTSTGLVAALVDETTPVLQAQAFQRPVVNLFDFSLSDLRYGPKTKDDGEYWMDRMNPNYIQLIFFVIYIAGAFLLVRSDDKDMTGICERQEVPLHQYLIREHILLSIFLSPFKTSLVTRVSRAYIFVTVTHCVLAMGGLFYFNDMEDIRAKAWDSYTNKDFLVAVYLALIAMLMAFILKIVFNPRVSSDRLVGYTVATCFNILFFIMCVWYTANLTEDPTNHWLLTWFLGWATYVCVLDFLVTLVLILLFDCLTIHVDHGVPLRHIPSEQPEELPEDNRQPLSIVPPREPYVSPAGGDDDRPELPLSSGR